MVPDRMSLVLSCQQNVLLLGTLYNSLHVLCVGEEHCQLNAAAPMCGVRS